LETVFTFKTLSIVFSMFFCLFILCLFFLFLCSLNLLIYFHHSSSFRFLWHTFIDISLSFFFVDNALWKNFSIFYFLAFYVKVFKNLSLLYLLLLFYCCHIFFQYDFLCASISYFVFFCFLYLHVCLVLDPKLIVLPTFVVDHVKMILIGSTFIYFILF